MPARYPLEVGEKERQAAIEEIRVAVQEGIASGHGRSADEVFNRLEAKYRLMSEDRRP